MIPLVSFAHLLRLSDDVGLFEHAERTQPRPEHGYCVDDVARGLVVVVHELAGGRSSATVSRLAGTYLQFLLDAQGPDGGFRNRRSVDGVWTGPATTEDCWGRALRGLGAAVAGAPELAERALAAFDRGARRRSGHLRAMAFAAVGAADVLTAQPGHGGARALLADAAVAIPQLGADPAWPWPEPRLRYANAVLPEALLAAGHGLGDDALQAGALRMLGWLLAVETAGGHLSVTPAAGWRAGEPRPGFDQQPIEVAALADACARAYRVTGEARWSDGVHAAAGWFLGANDAGVPLYDPAGGGGRDGLERAGCNENQGAESTLAMMSTFQAAHRLIAGRQLAPA